MTKRLRALTRMLLAGCLATTAFGSAHAQDLTKVKIVHGNPIMIPAVFELFVPLAMGWWRDEGFDVEVQFSQGSSAAVQAMIGGSGDIGVMNSTPWIAADSKGLADIRMVAAMKTTSWRILSMAKSNIDKPEDLKGKTIGLAVAGSGGAMYLNSILAKHGIDAQREVKQVVIGLGPQAYEALKSGTVDASLTFMAEIANFKVLGNDASYFVDEAWLDFPDYSMVATGKILSENPKLVEALARGVAKAQVFAEANPECVAKIYRKNHGAGRPTTLEQDTEIARLNSEENLIAFRKAGGELRANVSADGLDKLQNFLLENKQIPQVLDVSKLMPNDLEFFKRINDFDKAAIVAQAKECPGY
ncbi:MAG: ABC transporter substrate-binding protein [Mesorhizobium sp.]|nr:ABC transporter substrate-binding protein [Mesorhizobium sp.]MCO5160235.1 ABC transporter substrate-binding protein [Mesorhizobium sp.]